MATAQVHFLATGLDGQESRWGFEERVHEESARPARGTVQFEQGSLHGHDWQFKQGHLDHVWTCACGEESHAPCTC
jgi:hypothetical protein